MFSAPPLPFETADKKKPENYSFLSSEQCCVCVPDFCHVNAKAAAVSFLVHTLQALQAKRSFHFAHIETEMRPAGIAINHKEKSTIRCCFGVAHVLPEIFVCTLYGRCCRRCRRCRRCRAIPYRLAIVILSCAKYSVPVFILCSLFIFPGSLSPSLPLPFSPSPCSSPSLSVPHRAYEAMFTYFVLAFPFLAHTMPLYSGIYSHTGDKI